MYTITYSVGTSRNDERRYVVRDIAAADLARRISTMQAKGKVIYSVERTTEFGA